MLHRVLIRVTNSHLYMLLDTKMEAIDIKTFRFIKKISQ